MPPGAKKRKAAKKKQEEEQASSTQINLKSNNHDSRSQGEKESNDGVNSQENYKKSGEDAVRIEKDTDERIEITDSSHDHDKSSSSNSSSSSSSSSSDDESKEVKKIDDNKETDDLVSEVITVTSVPDQPVPIAGDAPFMGATANVIVENTGLMESAMPSDPKSGEHIEISHVETTMSNEAVEKTLPKPTEIPAEVSLASDEIRQPSSSATDPDVKESKEVKTSPLPESKDVAEGSRESEVVISHEEEASVGPTHGIAQRTSWFSCCGLFDVVTGSSR